MFDFLVIIIFIVVAVVTSGKKDKANQEVDLDFDDLASLDDFFKSKAPGRNTASTRSLPPTRSSSQPARPARPTRPARPDRQSPALPQRPVQPASLAQKQPSRLSRSSAEDTFHQSDRAKKSFAATNVSATDRPSLISQHQEEQQARARQQPEVTTDLSYRPVTTKSAFALKREDLVKSFILSEVMTRYNLNRIYDRIPDFEDD